MPGFLEVSHKLRPKYVKLFRPNIASLVTQDVQEYILYHQATEVHLIDSPDFDDCGFTDHEVLDKISTWINTVYSQKWTIGGILYLYDITRARLGGAGEQNVRVLEQLTGKDRWQHISLVTTKWHWSGSHENELKCERELEQQSAAWKSLREGNRPARMCRFNNTRESALDIISWHLEQSFEPALTYQMADPHGPQVSLGDTDAGQVILNSYAPRLLRQGNSSDLQKLEGILGHKFDNKQVRFAIDGMLAKLNKARLEHRLQQVGRWAIRLSMVGGTILVTLLTQNSNALAASVAAGSRIEAKLQRQRTLKKEEITEIESAIANAFVARPRHL